MEGQNVDQKLMDSSFIDDDDDDSSDKNKKVEKIKKECQQNQ